MKSIVFDEETIARRVQELGAEITAAYPDGELLVLVGGSGSGTRGCCCAESAATVTVVATTTAQRQRETSRLMIPPQRDSVTRIFPSPGPRGPSPA